MEPVDASLMAWLTPVMSVACSTSATMSTRDTFGVGTRTAMPSMRPCTSGMTTPVARAAPVVVGIMDTAPARARRRSLCGWSRSAWPLV